jgi:MFS transporter, DHA3 family, macrolide efflux protein
MRLDRNELLVIAARFISRTGGEAAFFVGIWGKAAYEFDASPGAIAILMAALGLSGLAGSAVAGMLIDRFGPKRVLMGSEVLFVPATLAVVATTDMFTMTLAAVAFGLFSAPTMTAIASFPPYLTTDESRLVKVNAAVETAGMAALISGSAIGAALASVLSVDWVFYLDALTSIVAVALVARVKTRAVTRAAPAGGGIAEIRAGFSYVYRHPRLRFYILVGTSMWLLFGLFSSLEPIFYRDVLGRGPEAIGIVNAILGIGLVAGTVAASRLPKRLRTARTVLWLLAANGAGAIVYIATANFAVVIVGAIGWGVVIGLFLPLVRTLIHVNSPDDMLGRVMGTTTVHAEAAKLIPLLVAPAAATAVGVQWPMAIGGLALIAMAALAGPTGAGLDRSRTVAVPPVAHGVVGDEPISHNP